MQRTAGLYIYVSGVMRVYRVPGFLSSRPNWSTRPLAHKGVFPPPPPPLGSGGTHSVAGEGVGGFNSDEGTDTLVLYAYYNPSTLL
jgi:hypothetical protein